MFAWVGAYGWHAMRMTPLDRRSQFGATVSEFSDGAKSTNLANSMAQLAWVFVGSGLTCFISPRGEKGAQSMPLI